MFEAKILLGSKKASGSHNSLTNPKELTFSQQSHAFAFKLSHLHLQRSLRTLKHDQEQQNLDPHHFVTVSKHFWSRNNLPSLL
jgi:hypothetical protein